MCNLDVQKEKGTGLVHSNLGKLHIKQRKNSIIINTYLMSVTKIK